MRAMQTMEAIRTRRAVRSWTDRAVAEEQLAGILDAGRFAPSPLNSQPWHFTVIRKKETIEKLMSNAHHGSFLNLANVVVVVTAARDAKVDSWLAEHAQHFYSAVCAIQNMWLAAWDMGVGACWVTVDEKTTRELLGIPANHQLIGSLALGYPAEEPAKPHGNAARQPLETMVSYETFA